MELLPLVGIALLFWLFIVRPASRRQKDLRRMQSSLATGDEIVLTSGFYGTVHELADDHVRVEIAPGVTVKVARAAVGTIAQKADEPVEEPDEATDEPHANDAHPGRPSASEEN